MRVSERMACRLAGLSRSAYRRALQADTVADPDAALREWLSEEDFTALFRVKRSLRDLMLISQAAQAHFEATYGTVGEGSASRA